MGSPRECPKCGGQNVGRIPGESARPKTAGHLLVRHRICHDCGYRGITGEFWAYGEYLAGVMEELASVRTVPLTNGAI